MDCSPPGSSVCGIFQARILAWVAISLSRGSSQPRDGTSISCIGRQILYRWTTWEAHLFVYRYIGVCCPEPFGHSETEHEVVASSGSTHKWWSSPVCQYSLSTSVVVLKLWLCFLGCASWHWKSWSWGRKLAPSVFFNPKLSLFSLCLSFIWANVQILKFCIAFETPTIFFAWWIV